MTSVYCNFLYTNIRSYIYAMRLLQMVPVKGLIGVPASQLLYHEASKVKPYSVGAHIIYEDMLDALDLNSVANEFVQDSEY